MRFVLSKVFKKIAPELPTTISVPTKSIKEALFFIDQFFTQYISKKIPIGLFNSYNTLITDLSEAENEEIIYIRPAILVAGGKHTQALFGGALILVGVATAVFFPPAAMLGYSLVVSGAGMVISDVLAPTPTFPSPALGESVDISDTPTYNFSSYSNRIGEQYAVPIVYGKQKIAGTIVDFFDSIIVNYKAKDDTTGDYVSLSKNIDRLYYKTP